MYRLLFSDPYTPAVTNHTLTHTHAWARDVYTPHAWVTYYQDKLAGRQTTKGGGGGGKQLPWRVSFLPASPYWPVKPLWLEHMQMAMTCSHKILKSHSNEAPGHNVAMAERSVEAGPASSLRHRRRDSFCRRCSSLWSSGEGQSCTLMHVYTCPVIQIKSQTQLHFLGLYPTIMSDVIIW